jgi:hypothetical protein
MYYHPFGNDRGLTLRDYFASQLYQSGSDNVEQAKVAYRSADAMLTVREMTDAQLNPPVAPVVAPVVSRVITSVVEETPVEETPAEPIA